MGIKTLGISKLYTSATKNSMPQSNNIQMRDKLDLHPPPESNPQPMLFRIIDDGTLPNNKKSHLKGCLATAAVVGDISSERGFIRLETLSCVEPDTNKVIDLNEEGTVFGPEGKGKN